MSVNSTFRTLQADNIEGVSPLARNYLKSSFETGTTNGWSVFNTTLTNGLPTGSVTAGSAAVILTATSSNPLSESYSMQAVATTGAAGHGFISDIFTIDRQDQTQVLTGLFSYEATSGIGGSNYSGILGSQTWISYIYDVTNSVWIQPAGFLGMTQNNGPGQCAPITFQTNAVGFGNQYRFAVLCSQAPTTTVTLVFDSFRLSRSVSEVGVPATDWQLNSTILTTTGFGTTTPAVPICYTRRVGDTMEFTGSFTAGTSTGSTASLNLSGVTIDASKLSTSTAGSVVGSFNDSASSTLTIIYGNGKYDLFYDGVTNNQIFIAQVTSTSGRQKATGTNIGSNVIVTFEFSIPIVGISSNVQMSNNTDTRVVTASCNTLAATGYTAGQNVKFTTLAFDTHGAMTPSTGIYLVPVSGYYQVYFAGALANSSPGAFDLFAYVDNVQKDTIITADPSSRQSGSVVVYANAGQAISIRGTASGAFAVTAGVSFAVVRVSGPNVIAASESVNARYYGATTFTPGGALVAFPTKDFDTHNAFNTSTNLYTVPISGKYRVTSSLNASSTGGLGPSQGIFISSYKNSTITGFMGGAYNMSTTTAATTRTVNGSDILQCVAGDTIGVYGAQDGGSTVTTLQNAAGYGTKMNYILIERIGN